MTTLTKKEIKESVQKMNSYSKKEVTTKEKARNVLIRAGIYTPSGKLAKPYRPVNT